MLGTWPAASRRTAGRTSPAQAPRLTKGAAGIPRGPRRSAKGEEMTPVIGSPLDNRPRRPNRVQIAAVLGLLTAVFSVQPMRAHAEDTPSEFSSVDPDLGLTREQWRRHVRETKRRVQEEAAQRRLEGPRGRVEPSQEDEARRISESVLNDDSLVPGDVVMTDKGMFVFRGRSNGADNARDFEPVEGPGLKAKGK